jgi:hypothetical protein
MRRFKLALVVLAVTICSGVLAQVPSAPAVSAQASERLSADTPRTTVLGNAFLAPRDWSGHGFSTIHTFTLYMA